MKIDPFGVEVWMARYENHCRYNIAETCVDSLTVEELLEISGKRDEVLADLLPLRLSYGPIEGSDQLRGLIAGLYRDQGIGNVLLTHGAAGANSLVHQTLIGTGDHVVTVVPAYQQHWSIPESVGGDVQRVWLREEDNWQLDLDDLRAAVRPNTRLIAVNNPNNPTGGLMDEETLRGIVEIADGVGAYLLCDEVYRGLHQDDDEMGASVADLCSRGIATSSMSKTFSLAGLRLGWITAASDILHAVSIHRDYNTISVGMLDDYFASLALANVDAVLQRSRSIVRRNLEILDGWVRQQEHVSYVRPRAGTTALLKYDRDIPSADLARELLADTGALLVPGSALGVEGYLRIGYAAEADVLRQGLHAVTEFLSGTRR